MSDLGTGIHRDVTREQYDRIERVNWSTLRNMVRSPAHYRHRLLSGDEEDTDAKKMGRAVHLATLEPERFRASVAVWTGGTRRGKDWDAFCESSEGLELLTKNEHERCLAIQAAVRADATAMRYLSAGGIGEATVLWTHAVPAAGEVPGYRFDCKGRVDFITKADAIVDLKTTRDAGPDAFGRSSWSYRYHAQAAFYSDGVLAATGKRLPYVIVAIEATAPHVVQVYRVPDRHLELGREAYCALLDRLAVCRDESRWPGYADGELELELPRWATATNEDEDITGLGLVVNE